MATREAKDLVPAGAMGSSLIKALDGDKTVFEHEDPAIVARRMAEQVLQAQSLDDVFAKTQTHSAPEVIGIPLIIRDILLRDSELENTETYALINAVCPGDYTPFITGEVVVVNTSSPRIMAQLCRAKDLGALDNPDKPLTVRVVEVGTAKPGQNAPLGLELVK